MRGTEERGVETFVLLVMGWKREKCPRRGSGWWEGKKVPATLIGYEAGGDGGRVLVEDEGAEDRGAHVKDEGGGDRGAHVEDEG